MAFRQAVGGDKKLVWPVSQTLLCKILHLDIGGVGVQR